MSTETYRGNAHDDQDQHRGWILGHFVEPHGSVRNTQDVEVKWGVHPAGQERPEWSPDQRTTLVLLVEGVFRVDLTTESVTLQRQGDYLVWGPGTEHSWQAEEDSVVITVRWPSLPA